MLDLLKKYFGYDQFRPGQAEVMEQVLAGKDALVLMPTGGGKSLCYQLPALAFPGLTLVVSPLIALMKDQVDALQANGIAAAFLNSSLLAHEVVALEQRVRRGEIKLLYVAPERLALDAFQAFLRSLQVSLIAIDEAHCISEWGHDFRPEYRSLSSLRESFPGVPFIALTATANQRVREDIVSQLRLQTGRIFVSSFNRPNLTYQVRPKQKTFEALVRILRSHKDEAVIVYVLSRKSADRVAADLRLNGFEALSYHAGLDPKMRQKAQEKFIRDEVPIIVATVAFGMGVNKPDVRLVVHLDLPPSVEAYYQETGRAGRDGLPSACILFYSAGDRIKREYFIRQMASFEEQKRARHQLEQMMRYAEQTSCRRAFLLTYFGEPWSETSCASCDRCVPMDTPVSVVQRAIDVFDQALFDRLRALRKHLAGIRHLPPYLIFGDRTLQHMARAFPQRAESLLSITGVGKQKQAQFGEAFLNVIRAYASEFGIKEQLTEAPPLRERKQETVVTRKSDTLEETEQLIAQGLSIQEMAKRRDLAPATIISHLERLQAEGARVDLTHLRPPEERFIPIQKAFEKMGSSPLAPAYAYLQQEYPYEELRLVRLFLQKLKK